MLHWFCCPLTIQTVNSCCLALLRYRLLVSWDYYYQRSKIVILTDEWRSSQCRPPDRYRFCWRAWSVIRFGQSQSSGLTCHNFLLHGHSRISFTQQTGSQINHVWLPGAVHFPLALCDFSEHNGNTVKSFRCVYEQLVCQFHNQTINFHFFPV